MAYIGLGSNIGEREKNLADAVQRLDDVTGIIVVERSSVKETAPVDYINQPFFLNQVVRIETIFTPQELLSSLQSIEIDMGRKKIVEKGPRIIDLDILLYGSVILETDDLTIPHREIKNRKFIMEHLVEIDPDMRDPLSKLKYSEIMNNGKTGKTLS